LLISGEPGIGKTRLLDELLARSATRGFETACGTCREDDGAPPYWPWPEIVGELASRSDDRTLGRVLEKLSAVLGPEAGVEQPALLTSSDVRFRLLYDVAQG